MIDAEILKAYNEFRQVAAGETLCPAPTMNLHFSQLGIVTACCFNRNEILGIYPEHSLHEIWEGQEAQQLRQSLQEGNFPKGCEKCSQQILSRDFFGSHANFYSQQAKILSKKKTQLGLPSGALPMKLEFNIHNACNLQCIMCHGLASSSIRLHREGLHAMPNPYDDAFVEQLKEFLPYVVETDFMGGEPFMIAAYQEIWKAISQINPQIKTCILTNATILNDSIKSLLESFNCWIHVSIDSFKKDTYETIRRGASYEEVMDNCDYFNQLMKSRGLPLVWRYCPMRINWHEIPETVSYCTERGIKLFYNQVDSPIDLSLTTLPFEELNHVVDTLTTEEPKVELTDVGLENLQNYRELIYRLRGFLDSKNRDNALRSRLQAAQAVVNKYTPKRESTIKVRVNADEISEQIIPIIRSYFINRLNVSQAQQTNADLPKDAIALLESSQNAVLELANSIQIEQFIQVYLKELMRVISGVWGVKKVHKREIFKQIDAFISDMESKLIEDIDTNWNRILKPEPLEVYQKIAYTGTTQSMHEWLNEL